MTDLLMDPQVWLSLLTLSVLEIVLGIDNIIFISILAAKLAPADQPKARRFGLMGAFVSRVALLLSITWVMQLTAPLLTVLGKAVSGRDLILMLGGLFLIGKATMEIHSKLEGPEESATTSKGGQSLWGTVAQIAILDIIFSLDSVITAIGMADSVVIMIAANVIALLVMLLEIGTACDEAREREVAIVLFVSEFLDTITVCDKTYDATRDRLHGCDLAMVKIVVIVGYYAFVSYTLNAFRIPLLVERSGG
jgi:predicted tellurium resistance membrane protein TerC